MVSESRSIKCVCDCNETENILLNCSVANRYSLRTRGRAPGVSVGHTCMFIPSEDGGNGKLIVVGGANPSSSFSGSHIMNLGKK